MQEKLTLETEKTKGYRKNLFQFQHCKCQLSEVLRGQELSHGHQLGQ